MLEKCQMGKVVQHRKNIFNPLPFFLEILKAVYFSFDWVPKLIQRSFQTREQKIVQHCETKVGADACTASYEINEMS